MDIYDMKPGIRLILPLVLAVAVVSIYGRTLGYDFCRLDDPIYIKNNKWVQSGLSIEGVQKAFTQPLGHVYIPMVALSYMVDVELFGNRPWGFHLTNLVFHLLNTLLLFFIFRKIPELEGPAAVMALLLAVHPIHVESVAWIAERKDVLSAFFFLLTIGAYHRWTLEQSVRLYLLSLLLFLLGLMSKAMLVSLPLCLLLLDFWPLGRLSGGRPGGIDLKLSLKPLLEKVPFFLLAGLFSLATLGTAGSHEVKMGLDLLPLVPRIENALISYTVYLTKLVWPWNLGVLYPHPKLDVSHWQAAASGVFLLFLLGTAFQVRRRAPYLLTGLLWYFITLVPVIGLVQVGPQGMADRFVYIPFMGIYLIIGAGFFILLKKKWERRRAVFAGAAIILAFFLLLSFRQAGFWKDNLTLFSHTTSITENNWLMETNVARILADRGQIDEALEHMALAWQAEPWSAMTNFNLGVLYQEQHLYLKSIFHFRRALKIDPNYPHARALYGVSLAGMAQLEEAIKQLTLAMKTGEDLLDIHLGLGRLYEKTGQKDLAVESFRKALEVDPQNQTALDRLKTLSQENTNE